MIDSFVVQEISVCVLIKWKRGLECQDTEKEKISCEDKEIEMMHLQARKGQRCSGSHQKPGERCLEQISLQSPPKKPTLLTPGSQNSSLHSWEAIHFYCWSHSVCGTLVQPPWQTKDTSRNGSSWWTSLSRQKGALPSHRKGGRPCNSEGFSRDHLFSKAVCSLLSWKNNLPLIASPYSRALNS